MTEEEAAICFARAGVSMPSTGVRAPSVKTKRDRRVFDGPLDVTLVLYGHCPSKKNLWKRGGSGKMYLDTDVKHLIDGLTMQAVFHWPHLLPVEHPELTVRFFVAAKGTRTGLRKHPTDKTKMIEVQLASGNRDRDGMLVTVLDCLQVAGVLANDDIERCNARMIIEPCEFVNAADERVEIRLEKK